MKNKKNKRFAVVSENGQVDLVVIAPDFRTAWKKAREYFDEPIYLLKDYYSIQELKNEIL